MIVVDASKNGQGRMTGDIKIRLRSLSER